MEVNGDFSSTPCMSTGGYLMGILYGDIQPILYLPDGFNIYIYIRMFHADLVLFQASKQM